jgi:hypothetical protein
MHRGIERVETLAQAHGTELVTTLRERFRRPRLCARNRFRFFGRHNALLADYAAATATQASIMRPGTPTL